MNQHRVVDIAEEGVYFVTDADDLLHPCNRSLLLKGNTAYRLKEFFDWFGFAAQVIGIDHVPGSVQCLSRQTGVILLKCSDPVSEAH